LARYQSGQEGALRRIDLAGAAHLAMVAGVVQLRPEDAMVEAMLRGWQAQQTARGLRDATITAREQLVRRFLNFTNEYPWRWTAAHVDEWSLWMTSERHMAPSTIRGYQTDLRLFTEFLTDNARYGWVSACENEFGSGVHPVAIVHEWNSIVHLNSYEGNPDERPFTRERGGRADSLNRRKSCLINVDRFRGRALPRYCQPVICPPGGGAALWRPAATKDACRTRLV
jgi:hypothetical protein